MMRITLNQIEIELALKNYVNKLLSVQDGIDMTIDIKATRGEGGMTAEIELSENVKALSDKIPATPVNRSAQTLQAAVATPAAVAAPVQVTQPTASVTRIVQRPAATQAPAESATAAVGSGMPTATVQATSVDLTKEVMAAEAGNVAATVNTDGPAAQDPPAGPSSGGTVEQPAAVTAPVEVVKKPAVGLFANLKKPVNTPTPE
jgi:hypothetical protein